MSPSAFDRVLDELGRAIVAGELPEGHADTVEGLVARTGASRSVVREATRVLGSLGMLSAGRRVGLRVRGAEHWDTLDPWVIRWRLARGGEGRRVQIDELRALRRAVEPEAAAAAARTVAAGLAREGEAERLVAAGKALGRAPDSAGFLAADAELHAAVLALSGNTLFARLRRVIEEGLRDRALLERADLAPDARDVALHAEVCRAVVAGEAAAAAAAMREIVERTVPGR
ncbi:FadR/GntR family transcriptional regulator [Brachybacterium hainanense]|uniref:FadR/GntR family transcriptional regulator n=1 Tax=Brachybacterium hainanense TaxID=1541174 RepID=A0ABV6REM0_9MICO